MQSNIGFTLHRGYIANIEMDPKEIKREANQLWEGYFHDVMRKCQYEKNFGKFIRQQEARAEKEAIAYLQPWLQILEESIQWLANLAGILDRLVDENCTSNSLRIAMVLVGASCAHAVALRRLVLSGLDSSARAILRSLDEHLMACIVLLHDRDLANAFQRAQDIQDASEFWYRNLKTKALNKRLNKIERELDLAAETSQEIREWREEEIKTYSQDIHPSYVAAALAMKTICASKPNEHGISILGRASAASERTLNYACKTIWYFSRLGFLFLFNEYNELPPYIELVKEDEMHQMVVIGSDVINELNKKYWEFSIYNKGETI